MSSRGGRGGGRGEYYRNKYGGGRTGRGRANSNSSRGGRGRVNHNNNQENTSQGGSYSSLSNIFQRIDGQSYPAYHSIESPKIGWEYDSNPLKFRLFIRKTQSDPYAPPTQCRIVIPSTSARYPSTYISTKIRAIATADFLHRRFHQTNSELSPKSNQHSGGGWKSPKGGFLEISPPIQHVMEQSTIYLNSKGDITVQFSLPLPARGRTILGREAQQLLCNTLPTILQQSILYSSITAQKYVSKLQHHVDSITDQEYLRNYLSKVNCIGFVPNGSILPRESGDKDGPLSSTNVVPFLSPKGMEISILLPSSNITITGMGVPKGITLIVGGGFHGKSTLLEALQYGIYNKIPGDGREFVVLDPNGTKIRSEDGRKVSEVDISPFIGRLPGGKETNCFSSLDASGSTSQASNIMEAIEMGVTTLLVDEDTCATNFMIRDEKMMRLVAKDKEPITPFVQKIRPLYEQLSVSSVLVIGGSGDYFGVADKVIMMDHYQCIDVTERAHEISPKVSVSCNFGTLSPRFPKASCLNFSNLKTKVRTKNIIEFGDVELDLSGLEQLVNIGQTNGIIAALKQLSKISESSMSKSISLHEAMCILDQQIEDHGLQESLSPGYFHGNLFKPRIYEIAGALNRLRKDGCLVQRNVN